MKRALMCLLTLAMIFVNVACSSVGDGSLGVRMPSSSNELEGEPFQDVVNGLEKAGFTNVETRALGNLITGFLHAEGEVKEVAVDGVSDFNTNDSFPAQVKIIVSYHSFPPDEDFSQSEVLGADIPEPEGQSGPTGLEAETSEISQPEGQSEATSLEVETSEIEAEPETTVLTVENNEDLVALLAAVDDFDLYAEFGSKYKGRIIEFDGVIAAMNLHGDYDTRFDILIFVGDSVDSDLTGPSFRFTNVNIMDLNLTGSIIPDTIGVGQKLRITARIDQYDAGRSDLFFLDPVSNEIRE